jgi:phosphotriesterase-related protein
MNDLSVVNTVLGVIPSHNLGITLSHEHLAMNPGDPVRYGDSIFDEIEKIKQDVTEFTSTGGKTIVEMTPLNFGRDVLAYREISRATGAQVICATGFHKEEFIPSLLAKKGKREVIELLKNESSQGISSTGIRPGVIKIGTSYNHISDVEKRFIEIVSVVQQETMLAISTHCDKGTMALELCSLLKKFGAYPDKVILGHVDIPNDIEYLIKICALGFNVQIDHVGRDKTQHDIVKIRLIKDLIKNGFINQIFLSGDMGKRIYMKSYGGWPGLGYILGEFKGYLLENGITEMEIENILVKNPRRVFGIPA